MDFIRRGHDSVKWDLADPDVLPMWVADMDFPAPEPVIEALRRRLDHPYLGYGLEPPAYFQAFMDWTAVRQGWTIQREWLQFVPSVMAGLRLGVDLFSSPGDEILVPSPVYYPFFSAVKDKGRVLKDLPLVFKAESRRYEFDFDALEKAASSKRASLLLLCNPHNPLGRVWERDELETLVEICVRNGVFIISDEIHADIIHKPHKFTSLVSLLMEAGEAAGGFAIHSPSKSFNIPGIASALMVAADLAVRSSLGRGLNASGLELPNVLALEAARAAYEAGGPWLDEVLSQFEQNRRSIAAFLDETLPPADRLASPLPEGSYLYWICLKESLETRGIPAKDAMKRIKQEARLWLSSGHQFSDQAAGYVRLNFGCPPQVLQEGLSRLGNWLGH